jgi:L-ascorbate metabolism protein UlaG (beta-lactamase superfamily)
VGLRHVDYASLRTQDLLPAFLDILRELDAPEYHAMLIAPFGIIPSYAMDDDESDWWDSNDFEGLKFTCTPARHFSGRGITDRATTLWCSWAIKSDTENLFFSGDSGYGPHFKEIGEKLGPFDFAMMECGQYNKQWSSIHMMPEETVDAAMDVKASIAMPIHWGAFTLAFHSWTDPVERFTKKAKSLNLPICTPRIGEAIVISKVYPKSEWWKAIQ